MDEADPLRLLYRVGRAPDPLAWPPPNLDGRYNDPHSVFRVLYAASERRAAFLETLVEMDIPEGVTVLAAHLARDAILESGQARGERAAREPDPLLHQRMRGGALQIAPSTVEVLPDGAEGGSRDFLETEQPSGVTFQLGQPGPQARCGRLEIRAIEGAPLVHGPAYPQQRHAGSNAVSIARLSGGSGGAIELGLEPLLLRRKR